MPNSFTKNILIKYHINFILYINYNLSYLVCFLKKNQLLINTDKRGKNRKVTKTRIRE